MFEINDYVKIIVAYLNGQDLGDENVLEDRLRTAYTEATSLTRTADSNTQHFIYSSLFEDKQWKANVSQFGIIVRFRRTQALHTAFSEVKRSEKYNSDEAFRKKVLARFESLTKFIAGQQSNHQQDWERTSLQASVYTDNLTLPTSSLLTDQRLNMGSTGNFKQQKKRLGRYYLALNETFKTDQTQIEVPYTIYCANTLNGEGIIDGEIAVFAFINVPIDPAIANTIRTRAAIYLSAYQTGDDLYTDISPIWDLLLQDCKNVTGDPRTSLPKGILFYRKFANASGYQIVGSSTGDVGVLEWSAFKPNQLRTFSSLTGEPNMPWSFCKSLPNRITLIPCSRLIYQLMPFTFAKRVQSLPSVESIHASLVECLSQLDRGTQETEITDIICQTFRKMQKNVAHLLVELDQEIERVEAVITKINEALAQCDAEKARTDKLIQQETLHWLDPRQLWTIPKDHSEEITENERARVELLRKHSLAVKSHEYAKALKQKWTARVNDMRLIPAIAIAATSHEMSPYLVLQNQKLLTPKNGLTRLSRSPATPGEYKPKVLFSSPVAIEGRSAKDAPGNNVDRTDQSFLL